MSAVQPRNPFRSKPLAPGRDKATTTPQGMTHGIPGRPRSPEQNHAGPPRIFGPSGPAPRSSGEFPPFTFRQDHRVFHEHDYSL